jgi:uncharacterized paraquat-inducible protein A
MSWRSLVKRIQVSYKKSYSGSFRYCTRCRAFYKTGSPRCPVCGTLLRINPRKRRNLSFKTVEITPELEKELESIQVNLRIVRKT